MSLSAERKLDLAQRILPTLVTQLKSIREGSGNAGGVGDPRATLKSRFDSSGQTGPTGFAHRDLMLALGLDEGVVTPGNFNEMVDAAALQL